MGIVAWDPRDRNVRTRPFRMVCLHSNSHSDRSVCCRLMYRVRIHQHCDDDDPCTFDFCQSDGSCTHSPITAACDDANACTYDDVCSSSVSVPAFHRLCERCLYRANLQRHGDMFRSAVRRNGVRVLFGRLGLRVCRPGEQSAGGVCVRTPLQDVTLHILSSPAIPDKLLDTDPNAVNTCDWCACSIDCAYRDTGRSIRIAGTMAPGMVPLRGWVDPTPTSSIALASLIRARIGRAETRRAMCARP